MRILILVSVVAGCSLPLFAEQEIKKPLQAKILLSNGDRLSGSPKFINAQQLALDSAYLNEPATFDIPQILSIQMDQGAITQPRRYLLGFNFRIEIKKQTVTP